MKTVNIDEYLKDHAVEFVLNGKKYVVKDVSPKVREMMSAEDIDERAIVKELLGCSDNDLEGYGIAAFVAIIREVTENLFLAPSQQNQ